VPGSVRAQGLQDDEQGALLRGSSPRRRTVGAYTPLWGRTKHRFLVYT
jgi:hypothetical protein